MAQQRLVNFGEILSQGLFKAYSTALFSAGIYSGFDVSIVDPQTLSISFGSLLMPSGVGVSSDLSVEVPFTNPSTATTYTVTATHDDVQAVGGSPVTFAVESGKLPLHDTTTGKLAIAYIYHTGAVQIAQHMIWGTPKTSPSDLKGYNLNKTESFRFDGNLADKVLGANITAVVTSPASNPEAIVLSLTNSGTSTQQVTFKIPVSFSSPHTQTMELYGKLGSLSSITLSLIGFDGLENTLPTPTVSGVITGLGLTPILSNVLSSEAANVLGGGIWGSEQRDGVLSVVVNVAPTDSVLLEKVVFKNNSDLIPTI